MRCLLKLRDTTICIQSAYITCVCYLRCMYNSFCNIEYITCVYIYMRRYLWKCCWIYVYSYRAVHWHNVDVIMTESQRGMWGHEISCGVLSREREREKRRIIAAKFVCLSNYIRQLFSITIHGREIQSTFIVFVLNQSQKSYIIKIVDSFDQRIILSWKHRLLYTLSTFNTFIHIHIGINK